jgi:hypothetical protein
MKVIGLYGNVYGEGPLAAMKGQISRRHLGAVSATIAAGTSEINRNVIATRGLGCRGGKRGGTSKSVEGAAQVVQAQRHCGLSQQARRPHARRRRCQPHTLS